MGATQESSFGRFSGWRRGPVLHCKGSRIGLGCRRIGIPHHGHRLFTCPSCEYHLGCDHCVGLNVACIRCHIYQDGTHVMPQERAKQAMRILRLVLDDKMTVDQALDAMEGLGVQEKVPF